MFYKPTYNALTDNWYIMKLENKQGIWNFETEKEAKKFIKNNLMAKTFKLTNKQKEVLLGWGYKEYDFNQIEECVNSGIITNEVTHRKISWQTAIKKIGEREFLSGIARASYHWTAMRTFTISYTPRKEECVYFDFSKYFMNI